MALRSSNTLIYGIGLACLAAPAYAQGVPGAPGTPAAQKITFSKDILPLLQLRCGGCHAGNDARAGLRLDSFDNIISGATKGAVVTAGQPDRSPLYLKVANNQMPPNPPKLTVAQKAALRQWILSGATDDTTAGGMEIGAAEKPLEIMEPKDGAPVREKVKIVIPKAGIPPEGFIGVYIDNRFKMALAPPSAEEAQEKKLKADAPLTYIWDTKSPITNDTNVTPEDRVAKDGPHLIEIRAYKSNGEETERARAQVNLQNGIVTPSTQPIPLWYGGRPGSQYVLTHQVDLQATAASGARSYGGASLTAGGGGDKILHDETTRYLVSLEDMMSATGVGFWRERRESPINISVNNLKQIVKFDTSSRYYSLTRKGDVLKSKVMERENRVPILNPIDLPGRPQRLNQTFTTNLRINLGAYIPGALVVDRVEATILGLEWQNGEECAHIQLNYLAGNAKVNIKSVNIQDAALEITKGKSDIWFSTKTNRMLKAKHEVEGNLVVEATQGGGGVGGPGSGPGGEFGPGGGSLGFDTGGSGAPYGGAPGGSPYGGRPSFGGAPYGGASGGAPYGAPGGAPYGGASGGSPYGGALGGAPAGGTPLGGPGAGGSYGVTIPGGGAGSAIAPTTKRYFVKLNVSTQLVEEKPGAPRTASAK